MSNTTQKNLTAGSFWTAVGIGILAAPFTGGMSLAYAASTIAVAGAVDKSKELSADTKDWHLPPSGGFIYLCCFIGHTINSLTPAQLKAHKAKASKAVATVVPKCGSTHYGK